MTYGNYSYTNASAYYTHANFCRRDKSTPILQKPIEGVENVLNTAVDTFVKPPATEEEKKSNKRALKIGSAVIVALGLATLLNPRSSGKFVNKLKTWASQANSKAKTSKDNFFKSKFYAFCTKTVNGAVNIAQFTNSINAGKDIGFKWLTSKEKTFSKVKNESARNFLVKADSGFRSIADKTCIWITNFFDNISKKTVQGKYKRANKRMDSLEKYLELHKEKLSASEKVQFEQKLKEIRQAKNYYSETQIDKRLKQQEKIMSNVEPDFRHKWKEFWSKFQNPFKEGGLKNDKELVENNLSFWAEDILMPKRNILENGGKETVNKLVGDGKTISGKYNEIIDLLSPHLNDAEKTTLQKSLNKTSKRLRKANHSECVEYFDKKRDLMLGGAPTDVLTNAGALGLAGLAVGVAHNKEDRTTRALTLGFPAVAGICTSLAMTGMLFSGATSLAVGGLASIVFSKIGSILNKQINPYGKIQEETTNA